MGVDIMKVISHFPKTNEGFTALYNKMTCIHAETVITKIKEMNFSEDEAKRLVDMICNKIKSK